MLQKIVTLTCLHCSSPTNTKYNLCNECLKNDTITITSSSAKKKYKLLDTDLNNVNMVKRRYYLPQIIKLSNDIILEKKRREEEKSKRLEILKIERISKIKEYLKTKSDEYVKFIDEDINGKNILESFYLGAFLDEEIFDKLDKAYDDYYIRINSKKMRRADICSVIEKHEMKDYLLYREKLNSRIDEYVKYDELTLLAHFLTIQEEYNRIKELYDKFNEKGITPRLDSYLCKTYMKGGLSAVVGSTNDMGNISSVSDIVDVMAAMDFLYQKTSYQAKLNQVHNNKWDYRDQYQDLATIAKLMAVKEWIGRGNKFDELPQRLRGYCSKF